MTPATATTPETVAGAPSNGTSPAFRIIPLASIKPSKANPRKAFDADALKELAASIKAVGVLEPIVVRPHPDGGKATYELVIGERRWRASRMAKQETIPAIIRDLTDLQAIEANLIEQLHRSDLSPMEEANGYHRLLNDHGFSVEDIAEKIGKSRRHVLLMLQLRQIPTTLQTAVEARELPYTVAVLIARVPNDKLREEAAKALLDKKKQGGQFPTVKQVQEEIADRYMIELKQTPFDQKDTAIFDSANVCAFEYRGSCAACPKRTGNAKDEYPDAKANICTDPPCYRAKVKASVEKRIAAAEAEGLEVLDQDESETALRHGVPGQNEKSRWLALGADWGKTTVEAKLKDKLDRERTLAHDKDGHPHWLVPRRLALPILDPAVRRGWNGSGGGGKTRPAGPSEAEVEEYARERAVGDVVEGAREAYDHQSTDRAGRWCLEFLAVELVGDALRHRPSIEAHPGLAVILPEVFAEVAEARPAALRAWADRAPPRGGKEDEDGDEGGPDEEAQE
jgi:ParB/RepB/Spo0J family partition protein